VAVTPDLEMRMELDTLGGLAFLREHLPTEQRTEDRLALSRQPDGKLSVLTPFTRLGAMRVRDISRSGISVELERPISPETPVSVEYVADEINLSVTGRLAWARQTTPDGDQPAAASYVVGIELFSPGLLLNFLPTAASQG
jgi:hypothetical protein